MSDRPIGDHALLSDSHSAALVDRRGSVEWLCLPRFDSPSVFARLLDDSAGHFRVGPTGDAEVSRCYLHGTLVLVTTFRTSSGTVELSDALAMGEGPHGHDLGAGAPHVLLRRVRCTQGTVELEIDFVPRFEYGLTYPLIEPLDGGLSVRGGADQLVLAASIQLDIDEDGARAHARVDLEAGQALELAMQHTSSWSPSPAPWEREQIAARLDDTIVAWTTWHDHHQRYDGPYAALVDHSGRVLQGLTYQPSGAIVAAPTTSLPETVGGERNWDYRYAWIRDASMTMDALWVAACPDEAGNFLNYLTTVATSTHRTADLQIMFGIEGQRDLTERTLGHLDGWRGSRPVRIGNGAWTQTQLDVYGELLAAVHRLSEQIGELAPAERRFLIGLADAAARRWQETDQGIWEIRGEPQHHVYSKLMCWTALVCAADLAPALHAEDRVEGWRSTAQQIRAAILTEGWNEDVGAFTQAFGSDALDASVLVLPLVGLLPTDDPRVLATIEAIEDGLTDERGLVYRYRADDGLEGEEGTFLLCTFWLAEALARAGRVTRAREVFERAVAFCNDVDLLAEEVDPASRDLLGNFPQAFSHIGLINAAWAIERAEHGQHDAQAPGQ
ncbi:MAG: glycoside hydrolase family 15 protein [Nitriliruptoraceae bacterium]